MDAVPLWVMIPSISAAGEGPQGWTAGMQPREGSSQQEGVSIPSAGPVIQGRASLSPGVTGLQPPNCLLLKIKMRTSKNPLGCGRMMDKGVDSRRLFVGTRTLFMWTRPLITLQEAE